MRQLDLKKTTQEPRATIIMAAYNAMPYLPEAIESIRKQTFKEWKMVVVDDASTDDTADYLNQLNDPRITVNRLLENVGQGFARNFAIESCTTEYTAFMDADDVSLPERLEAQVAFLDAYPEVGLVGTRVRYMGEGGRTGMEPPLPCDHATIDSALLEGRHGLVNSTICCRTALVQEVGGFRIAGRGEDWDLFLRMAEKTRLANLDRVLFHYRLHGASTNSQHLWEMRRRIAHACDSARRRRAHQPEQSYESFCETVGMPRLLDRLDLYGLAQYRRALGEILSPHPFHGYLRLAWAALAAPRWTLQRVLRALRR